MYNMHTVAFINYMLCRVEQKWHRGLALSLKTQHKINVHICSNKNWAQTEAGARIQARCQLIVSLIEAGAQIRILRV